MHVCTQFRQRTRQPTTVASMGCLFSTFCQAPPLHRHMERNDISADVILAKELKRLICRWHAFVKGIDSCLACHHAVLIIRAQKVQRCDGIATCLYDVASFWNQPARIPMAFKPNYGRDRAERARAARAKIEEKQRKKDEKTALRKAAHAETEPPADGSDPLPNEKQS